MNNNNILFQIVAIAFFSVFQVYAQDPVTRFYRSNPDATKPFILNFNESNIPSYTLSNPLITYSGKPVADAVMWWKQRRPEILSMFENEMYGKTPVFSYAREGFLRFPRIEFRSEKTNSLNGKAIRREVRLHFTTQVDGPYIDILLYFPVATSKPVPAFVMLNFRGNQAASDEQDIQISESWMTPQNDGTVVNNLSTELSRGVEKTRSPVEMIIERGYAFATSCYHDIAPDYYDGFHNGIHSYFYKEGQTRPAANEWGSIGAWALGLSRILDYLETVPEIHNDRVAVVGHSRLGKTALWAGAQDQRFAMVIANNSGCGGSALSKRIYGETVSLLNYVRPHWFCSNFAYYNDNETALPFDQHELIALIAPRPVYISVAANDHAADPKGEFLAALNADAVYKLLDTPGLGNIPEKDSAVRKENMIYDAPMPEKNKSTGGTIGFHIRDGEHDMTIFDWEQFLNFADSNL